MRITESLQNSHNVRIEVGSDDDYYYVLVNKEPVFRSCDAYRILAYVNGFTKAVGLLV